MGAAINAELNRVITEAVTKRIALVENILYFKLPLPKIGFQIS
jgi:hypothetical protein